MSFNKITNHIEQALDKIIEQHKEKSNFENLLRIFLERVQSTEDDLESQHKDRRISRAAGQQLNNIARDLNITRDGDSDSRLRTRCYAQIAQYWSSGKVERIVTILNLLVEATEVRITEVFPAKIKVQIKTDFPLDSAIKDVIQATLAAGVGFEEPIISISNNYFGFSNDDQAQGFTLVSDLSVGGFYSIII